MGVQYPHFIYAKDRGQIFANISLPENFLDLVLKFYSSGGKEMIEEFARHLDDGMENIFGKPDIMLKWDQNRGLEHIAVGASGGLDLNDRNQFQEHNLGTETSLITGAIAINYVHELLKMRKE